MEISKNCSNKFPSVGNSYSYTCYIKLYFFYELQLIATARSVFAITAYGFSSGLFKGLKELSYGNEAWRCAANKTRAIDDENAKEIPIIFGSFLNEHYIFYSLRDLRRKRVHGLCEFGGFATRATA